jgi:hypothetical protein
MNTITITGASSTFTRDWEAILIRPHTNILYDWEKDAKTLLDYVSVTLPANTINEFVAQYLEKYRTHAGFLARIQKAANR